MKERAAVFKHPEEIQIFQEGGRWGNALTGIYNGTRVGVSLNGQEVWGKTVTPFFVGLRTGWLMDIPKPFYGWRIKRATQRAENLAQTLNNK